VLWLNKKLFEGNKDEEKVHEGQLLISFKILYLGKAIKRNAKEVLSVSDISSIDEYSFLLHLLHQDSFRKMEIIELHNLETPTGIDIIKRLVKNGMVLEFPDEQDKRAKRIKISPNGIKEVEKVKQPMDELFQNFTRDLSTNEKILLSGTLDSLIKT
jgi:DNA-binding MarR family transcriptional regulator